MIFRMIVFNFFCRKISTSQINK